MYEYILNQALKPSHPQLPSRDFGNIRFWNSLGNKDFSLFGPFWVGQGLERRCRLMLRRYSSKPTPPLYTKAIGWRIAGQMWNVDFNFLSLARFEATDPDVIPIKYAYKQLQCRRVSIAIGSTKFPNTFREGPASSRSAARLFLDELLFNSESIQPLDALRSPSLSATTS